MKLALLGVAAAAFTLTGAPASAHPGFTDYFRHATTGYSVRVESDGRQMCVYGTHRQTREKFRVHVSTDGRVTGTWKGQPVDFTVAKTGDRTL